MNRFSLKYRIALTVFALTGVMLAVLMWQVHRMQDDAMAAAQASDEAVIMDVLGELSRFSLIKSEYSDLEHYFSMVRRNPQVVKIIVADSADRIVMSTDAGLLGLPLPLQRNTEASRWRTRKLINAAGPQGLLAVEFSNAETLAARKRTRTWAAVVALASMTLIALVSVIMGAALTRRLAALAQASKRIGDGDFGTRIDLPGSDEVSELGRTVNTMARKIEAALGDLKVSEHRFTSAFEHASIGMALVGLDERFIQVNQSLCNILGYPREKLLTMTVTDVTHPDDRAAEEEHKKEAREGGNPDFQMVKRYLHADGRVVWGQLSVSAVTDSQGKPQYFIGQLEDITARKRAEEALRHSEEQYRLVVENASDAIFIAQDGQFKFANAALVNVLGYTRDEIIGRPFANFIHPDDRQMVLDRHKKRLQGQDPPRMYEFRVVTRSGTTRWAELNVVMVEWEGRPATLNFLRDITQQKKLEQQLLQAQKMEAVGQLAGGIAHDFNNILTAIIGYGNVALMKIPKDDPVRSSIDQILASADRAAGLTRSLLAFSRKQFLSPQPVTVNSIIDRVRNLLHRVIGEDIEFRTVLTAQDTTVLADSGQIEPLLINLATNARDAMPKGGQLTIETGLAQIDDEYIRHHGYGKTGAYVLISISDTGEGMDEPTRQRVFEPFFTTKEVGKGTGLGLAMVYGSVKQHNGYINVYSEPGKGTTFKIYLPVLHAAARPLALSKSDGMPKGGNETILLAEDDQAVRNLTRSVLEDVGYTVIEAADGREAVERLEQQRDRIDLLIADVVMPKKNGEEVLEEARRLKPGIKVLFTSGYPANIIQGKGIIEQGLPFISKPASLHDLLRKIREVLDQ